MHHLRLVVVALALALGIAPSAGAQRTLEAKPVVPTLGAVPADVSIGRAEPRVGRLGWMAGFELRSKDPDFGGLSGFAMTPDKDRLVGVSDRGLWILLTLKHDDAGRLVDVPHARVFPLLGTRGERLSKQWGDAEDVVLRADGSLIVSFEHEHRLAAYARLDALRTAPQLAAFTPKDVLACPPNGGVEAMTLLRDGGLLFVAEKPHDASGTFRGWRVGTDGKLASRFTYATTDGFQPTGMAVAADGRLVGLERRYSLLTGIAARLVIFDEASLAAPSPVATTELARFGGEVICDNFEALESRALPGKDTALYVGADDNYNRPAQRTLLIQLRLSAPAP